MVATDQRRVRIRPPGCRDESKYGWRYAADAAAAGEAAGKAAPAAAGGAPAAAAAPRAAAAAAEPVKPKRHNFTGTWVCTELEGDWSKLMTDIGSGWVLRTAASAMNYGKGKQKQIIQHDGDVLIVENHLQKVDTVRTEIGGPEQDVKGADGNISRVRTVWDGPDLVSHVAPLGPRKAMLCRRTMRGDQMVYSMTHEGLTVAKLFTKQ